jgi:hypothetical protein
MAEKGKAKTKAEGEGEGEGRETQGKRRRGLVGSILRDKNARV